MQHRERCQNVLRALIFKLLEFLGSLASCMAYLAKGLRGFGQALFAIKRMCALSPPFRGQ